MAEEADTGNGEAAALERAANGIIRFLEKESVVDCKGESGSTNGVSDVMVVAVLGPGTGPTVTEVPIGVVKAVSLGNSDIMGDTMGVLCLDMCRCRFTARNVIYPHFL